MRAFDKNKAPTDFLKTHYGIFRGWMVVSLEKNKKFFAFVDELMNKNNYKKS